MSQSGFTLIEMIAVLIIVGVLSAYSFARFSSSDSDLLAARDQLAAALSLAQQLALARQTQNNIIIFSLSEKEIKLTESNAPVNSHGLQFPLNDFSSRVKFSSDIISFCFNKMGEPQAYNDEREPPVCETLDSPVDFSVSNTLVLRLEPSGLVHVP